ncbi:unnamed protein product [Linum tenue]|uniref:Transposase n=1 Tax=Linum tenue TaxID=586396 RepID=A0AAV0IUX8_9ROSI|nr:unnamed protein product [Linum tenue]
MDDVITLILVHGGAMDMSGVVPQYVGGVEDVIDIHRDVVSYFEITKTLIEDLSYLSVERVWYLTPGEDMATGLHEVHSDVEVMTLLTDAEKGDLRVYFEATKDIGEFGYMGDNYGHDPQGSEEDGEQSAVPEILRVEESDDAQTSDEEYHEIMKTVRQRRQHFRAQYVESGDEVDQVLREDDGQSLAGDNDEVDGEVAADDEVAANAEVADDEGVTNAEVAHDEGVANAEVAHDEGVADDEGGDANDECSMETEYRASEESAHVRGDIGEEVNSFIFDKSLFYDPKCDHRTLNFKPRMRFTSPGQFKEAVISNAIYNGADIRWARSSGVRKEAVCANRKEYQCGWRVYASWWRKNECFMVKGVGEAHSCPRSLRIRAAGYKWMAKEYLETFRVNQAWDVGLIANEVKRKFNLIVSTATCYRARLEARRLLYGSLEEDFHQIRDYIGHLIKVDPQGKFLLEVDIEPGEDKVFFKRLYVGFSSLCKGFIAECRPFFCLDGCFLKGEVQGMLLSAVGKDGNNHMFPIAWAVVESENKSSWIWFVSALQEQLGTLDGKGFTIVSDQQKVFYFCW